MSQLERMSFAAVVITAGAFIGSALAAALVAFLFFKQNPAQIIEGKTQA
jgi:UDP-N-acetylmuramyl pentapeptide phosphotransferase/UDP-N-acetylglucosamine-1-phosphate transferase